MDILGKRRDREKALRPTSAVPVCQQLVSMEACPLPNETESSWLKAAGQDDAINRNGGPVAGVMRMEMRYRMVGLVPIHVYSDAVEGANTRHPLERTGRQLLESEETISNVLLRRVGLRRI